MIPGVTALAKYQGGVYFSDESGIIYAYDTSVIYNQVVIGEVYDIHGVYDVYFATPELKHAVATPLAIFPSSEAPSRPATITGFTIPQITDLPKPGSGDIIPFDIYEVTAKVVLDDTFNNGNPGGNYDIFLVDPSYEGSTVLVNKDTKEYLTDTIMIYYGSNKTPFYDLVGKEITLEVMILGWRTDLLTWYAGFNGTAADIQVAIADDAEAVALAKSQLPDFFETGYDTAQTVFLPSSIAGTTITYASESPYFDELTGIITLPAASQETVTLNITITRGAVTDTLVITFTVGEYPVLTIADALLVTTGTVRVQGVVTGLLTNRTYAVQDETGTIAVYSSNADWMTYIGKEIDLIGTRSAHKGLQQINPTTVLVLGDGEIPAPTNIDAVDLTSVALEPYMSLFVTRTGLEVVSNTVDQYGNVTMVLKDPTTLNEITLKYSSYVGDKTVINPYLANFIAGDNVNVVNIGLHWADMPILGLVDISQIILVTYVPETDQEKVDQAAIELADLPTEINAATTLTLPLTGSYTTTVAWTSSHPEIISEAGVVVVPVTGVTVTLTATITLNAATATRTFTILVQENILTVLEARNATLNDLIIVEGLITSTATDDGGNIVAFMEDETAGIYIYNVASTFATELVAGNIVKIYGTRGYFSNAQIVQVVSVTDIEVISVDNTITPLVVTDPTILPDIQAQHVEVSGYLREVVTDGSNFYLVTDQGQFLLRLASSSDLNSTDYDAIQAKLYNVAAGTMITVQAGLSRFGSTMQIMLFDETQITLGAVGTEQQLGEAALGNLVLPEASAELIANLTLPTSGLFGTTVSWVSDNEVVISNAGVVTRPAEGQPNAVVTLTYTVVNGATTVATNTIQFTVLAEAGVPTEQSIYTTGFDSAEGYTASTVYNNTSEILFGPSESQWGFIFGTASTTGAITDGQSAQMRWYTTSPTSYGSMVSKFTFTDVTKVEFDAYAYAGIALTVSYSLNGTDWLGAEAFTLTTSSAAYTYTINVTGSVYLKFQLTVPGADPTTTSRLIIDNINVYGLL